MESPEYWSGLPFHSPGDLPDPGIEPVSPASRANPLPSEPSGKPVISACWHSGGTDGMSHWTRTSMWQSRCGPGNLGSCRCGFFFPSARPFHESVPSSCFLSSSLCTVTSAFLRQNFHSSSIVGLVSKFIDDLPCLFVDYFIIMKTPSRHPCSRFVEALPCICEIMKYSRSFCLCPFSCLQGAEFFLW